MADPDSVDWPVRFPIGRGLGKVPPAIGGLALLFVLLLLLPVYVWFFCRIEPGADQIAILIRKTGTDLPSGHILAAGPDQKGIQLEVLAEGRYFYNPYTWGWEIHRVTDIPAGKLAVQTRLYGVQLPPGRVIATEGTKGIVDRVLRPGKYRINPYAYHVEIFDAITVRPGHVGVITSLVGADVLNNDLPDDKRGVFLVDKDMKGVLPEVIDPGTYYLNPYMVNVVEISLQSQRFGMSGDDAISFLTLDGFTVTVEGTIEFAVERQKAALLTHRVGDLDDIIKKVILPRARGFSRIEGSKHPAINFIVGETRQKFQSDLEEHLRHKTEDWGVQIKSVLVRKIIVPDQIASISRDREVAVQEAVKYGQQLEQAKSRAELVRQEMLAQQNKLKVEADTIRIQAVIRAQQDQAVRTVAAERQREVARLEKRAAVFEAQAVLNKARGDSDAIKAHNQAQAAVLAAQVKAFAGGMNLARYSLMERVGGRIRSILTSDQDDGLGALFAPLVREPEGSDNGAKR